TKRWLPRFCFVGPPAGRQPRIIIQKDEIAGQRPALPEGVRTKVRTHQNRPQIVSSTAHAAGAPPTCQIDSPKALARLR
ncbi:hypothetical protein, partial [Stenotrophomonas sp. DR009]|uniref:hypothetical protein n=1 Tax=Stenotrophomonas sp. DR009 TaxID=3398461 RepID=UPI003BB1B0A3